MPCPTVLPMARKVPLDNDDRNVRHGQFKMSSELLKFLNPVNAQRKGTGVFSCFIYTYSVIYILHKHTNVSIIWIARHTTESPGVRHISGSAGPRLASTSQPQPGASKRLRLSEEVKRRLLEMCVGDQVPVSGPASTVGGIIFETL